MNSRDLKETVMEAFGRKPKEIESASLRTAYYSKQIERIIKGLFDIKCPAEWDKDYMLDALIHNGLFCVTMTDAGVLPLKCGVHGLNVFERASRVLISNAVLGSMQRVIGADCVVVYLNDNNEYLGCNDFIRIYAQRLANCDACIDTNLINCKVATVFECEDSTQEATAKKLYDNITMGAPAVFLRKNNALGSDGLRFYQNNVTNTFIADKVQIEKRSIRNEMLTDLGINNANTDKRERLNGDEVNANNAELIASVEYWRENLRRCTEAVNAMFPDVEFSISLKRSTVELGEGESGNESSGTDGNLSDES